MEEEPRYYEQYETFGDYERIIHDEKRFNNYNIYEEPYFSDYLRQDQENLLSKEQLIGKFILKDLIKESLIGNDKFSSPLYDNEPKIPPNPSTRVDDDFYERLKAERRQWQEELRQHQERLAAERKLREEEARRVRERLEAEQLRRAQEAQARRNFSPLHEARVAEIAALFPELGDRNLRNLFATVLDSRAAGTPDAKIFRSLVKKYHPDTAPEDQRETFGRVIGTLSNLYDSKAKSFRLV